jgi:NAD(P)-dependent dehydrogenase (short-subunit alcohol dehydrogenase family)
MQLVGKSVVITGAGSGVGRACALLFAREGGRVVCADLRDDWAADTVRLIEEAGGTAVAVACDVVSEADVARAIATAVDRFARLDIMFNNVGIATPRIGMSFEDHTGDDFDRLMAVNGRGVFYGCRQAVLTFKAQGGGGVIVNTGSIAGLVGWGGTVYGASKSVVIQLTRGLAIEMAPHDIRVNCICPAAMPGTNFGVNEDSELFQAKPDDYLQWVAEMHPLGRAITPEDCAAAALYLASDASKNVTGVALPIDGGFVAR